MGWSILDFCSSNSAIPGGKPWHTAIARHTCTLAVMIINKKTVEFVDLILKLENETWRVPCLPNLGSWLGFSVSARIAGRVPLAK